MRRRGLTLFEILLALTIVVAVGALAVPVMHGLLAERAFQSAVDVTTEQLLLARAEAQLRGAPIEVVYRSDPPHVEARRFDPDGGDADVGVGETLGADEETPRPELVLPSSWAWRGLPRDVRIDHRPPEPPDAPGGAFPGDASALTHTAFLRLAVYLPDGSALVGAPAWIVDDDGRGVKITVNTWTGLPRHEPWTGETGEDDPDADLDEADARGERFEAADDETPRRAAPPTPPERRGGGA